MKRSDTRASGPWLPAPGSCLAPAFVDLQVNGFAGVDYNTPDTPHEAIARSIRVLFSTGVARFFPNVITAAPNAMAACLRNLARAAATLPEGEAIAGFHIEGPHISPEDGPRGAHPREWVRPPDFDEFLRWQDAAEGRIRIVTLAPEWPQAPGYIERLAAAGVAVSIGHTAAGPAEIAEAVRAGATMSTHLGNGAHQLLRRHPNYIWEQLAEDRLMAGFIADGIHLDSAFLKSAIRAKTPARSILVTDAATAAGAPPGRYRFGALDVDLTAAGRVVLAGTDRLAGSALRMDRGVENLVRLAGLPLSDALRMASLNPSQAARLPDRVDTIQFTFDSAVPRLEITATWLSGRQVYGAPMPAPASPPAQ